MADPNPPGNSQKNSFGSQTQNRIRPTIRSSSSHTVTPLSELNLPLMSRDADAFRSLNMTSRTEQPPTPQNLAKWTKSLESRVGMNSIHFVTHCDLIKCEEMPQAFLAFESILQPVYKSGRQNDPERAPVKVILSNRTLLRDWPDGQRMPYVLPIKEQNPSSGSNQSTMPYVGGLDLPTLTGGLTSMLNIKILGHPRGKKMFCCTHLDKTYNLPWNVRPMDDYLGCALFSFTTDSLLRYPFPADIAPDGLPFSDRPCCGSKYQPRIAFNDYPLPGGSFGPDERVGYSLCVQDGKVVDLYIFGGEGFSKQTLDPEKIRNFHHYYIEIFPSKKLLPVSFHPEEMRRQDLKTAAIQKRSAKGKGKPTTTQLAARGNIGKAVSRQNALAARLIGAEPLADEDVRKTPLFSMFENFERLKIDENNPRATLTREQAQGVIDQLYVRGFRTHMDSPDILFNTMLSAVAWGRVGRNYDLRFAFRDEHTQVNNTLAKFHQVANALDQLHPLADNESDPPSEYDTSSEPDLRAPIDIAPDLSTPGAIGKHQGEAINELARKLEGDYKFAKDQSAALEDIPEVREMIDALPNALFTRQEKMALQIVDAAFSHFFTRESWDDDRSLVFPTREDKWREAPNTLQTSDLITEKYAPRWKQRTTVRFRAAFNALAKFLRDLKSDVASHDSPRNKRDRSTAPSPDHNPSSARRKLNPIINLPQIELMTHSNQFSASNPQGSGSVSSEIFSYDESDGIVKDEMEEEQEFEQYQGDEIKSDPDVNDLAFPSQSRTEFDRGNGQNRKLVHQYDEYEEDEEDVECE